MMPGDIMRSDVYRAVHRLVGLAGRRSLPRPYLAADFASHPHLTSAVYIVTDNKSRVRYVGSASRKDGCVSDRIREHLRDASRDRIWAYVWFLPFGPEVDIGHVRLMERLVGERLRPTDNRRLPGFRRVS